MRIPILLLFALAYGVLSSIEGLDLRVESQEHTETVAEIVANNTPLDVTCHRANDVRVGNVCAQRVPSPNNYLCKRYNEDGKCKICHPEFYNSPATMANDRGDCPAPVRRSGVTLADLICPSNTDCLLPPGQLECECCDQARIIVQDMKGTAGVEVGNGVAPVTAVELVEARVGVTESSSGAWDVATLKVACGPYPGWDEDGAIACFNLVGGLTGYANAVGGMAPIRCTVDYATQEWWSDGVDGICDCISPTFLGSDAQCHELTCISGTDGASCYECADPLTRNNECKSCNEGYILYDGDCLKNICTEDPDDWTWQGCQECRHQDSRRHPQDCLTCAHGYHFLHEQRNLPNQTSIDVFASGSLVVQKEETGYCFPYTCIAGGDLENADATYPGGDYGPDSPIQFDSNQRQIKLTAIISTEQGSLGDGVHQLSAETLAFRDHCKTCVPQQLREKNDHCESCNPGYYLDEMHHTCRKKTCGVPHFRRNAVSCTEENLVPLPWSTPCNDCLDNSVACCVYVEPVMTCGAQSVFCHPGTQKVEFQSLECGDDGCAHYSTLCCDPMTCKNQQVGCRIDQSLSLFVLDSENVITNVLATCEFCTNGGSECCTDKPHTCGIKNVKCGRGQKHYPADTNCGDCLNEGLECCEPVQKTCSNQGVFCHAGTHKGAFSTILTCTDCENYGEECCEEKTCLNQRVGCAPGKERKDAECTDCIIDTLECCEPLPPVPETCGNQLVQCYALLNKPAATHCSSTEGTCDDYHTTCCFTPTCANQGVRCSALQAPQNGDESCVGCADNGEECCVDNKTCGLMGVLCNPGEYKPPGTACGDSCDHFGDTCCVEIAKTCSGQGVVCLPGTHMPLGTECQDCIHYGEDCCAPATCGNQQVGCSPGRPRRGDTVDCTNCHHDSADCCEPLVKTCAAMSVKCREGHYRANQAQINCDENDYTCTNYAEPCCEVFLKTCGNQNVVCSSDQTYNSPTTVCNNCVNHGETCCDEVTKTCANQDVVCRPGYKTVLYSTTECEDCLNDATPCCEEYKRTCGNQNVVCSADQTYEIPSTECSSCLNHGSECCADIAPTCSNQRVACRPGHYVDDYANAECTTCLNDDTSEGECCEPFQTTCGNTNVKCSVKHTPEDPGTECDGDECTNDSETCCIRFNCTCANKSVVCRPGHYVDGYKDTECGLQGCLHDSQPCCTDFKPTCGTKNIKCGPNQSYASPGTYCEGNCENYATPCCIDVNHTCGNQNVICRPGYYVEAYQSVECGNDGCKNHGTPCCEEFKKTCGNQDVFCSAGQTYSKPCDTCNDCLNEGIECCSDIAKTCKNQQVVCRPGHYADTWATEECSDCLYDATPCCKDFQTTCGNTNVKCSNKFTPVEPSRACDEGQCTNDSTTCCIPVKDTCANQNVVCRPGHYAAEYKTILCASKGCLNDQDPCCEAYVKTCQNQGVICTLGLMKHVQNGDQECSDCDNYSKECCEDITKTCGNSGPACRQDLYMPVDTECVACDVEQCCEPIPPPPLTCANQLHVCVSGFYKPHETVCPEGKCNDELCCHLFPVTCGNQNVQCHENRYLHTDTECKNCNHYDTECCEPVTCKSAGITCDTRYDLVKSVDYETTDCAGAVGECLIEDNAEPCCQKATQAAKAPTCGNKYGLEESDKEDWPVLTHLSALLPVTCDVSKGWYRRSGFDNILCGTTAQQNEMDNWSACQDNDHACCWRKTCANVDNYDNGFNNGGEGYVEDGSDTEIDGEQGTYIGAINCGDYHTLKDNPQYIVCQGDCKADCCDKIPDDETCLSERVACSFGFERKSTWESAICGAVGGMDTGENNCVENSESCCQRTYCDTSQVKCNEEQDYIRGALCFECVNFGDECCEPKPIVNTCSNQRVHCGYGYFKNSDYEEETCDNCYDNGDECCTRKTCGVRGVGDAVICVSGLFSRVDGDTECYNCVDNGAECCVPVIPDKTCKNQDVNCGFGFTHADVDNNCTDCLDNGDECCVPRTCGDTGNTAISTDNGVMCDAEGLKAKAGTTKCTLCMDNHDECCTKQETCWTSKIACPPAKYHKHPNLICGDHLPDGCSEETCCAVKTCENQGSCCNKALGFSKLPGYSSDLLCSSCADNCEECCSYDTPTCSSAKVGCGFGWHRKANVEHVTCDTCALNDGACCEPRTCGADAYVNGENAFECPELHDYLGDDTKCHFCEEAECCKPSPTETCRTENINCGVGMTRKAESNDDACSTCVQNDPICCAPLQCQNTACPETHSNKGDVLCVGCTQAECCDVIPTCESENVGCGFGFKYKDVQTQTCESCALNDGECCEPLTCGTEKYECPTGFADIANQDKKCAFCELTECCEPVVPGKTCSNQSVVCLHGYARIAGSYDDTAPTDCGNCEVNNLSCCAATECTDEHCGEGFHRKDNNLQCGFCSVEECCDRDLPEKTCDNENVGCGFGWKTKEDVDGTLIDRMETACGTCAHNDANCCQPKTCGDDGPTCSDHMMHDAQYTEKGAATPCSDCDLSQCCVPPVIVNTCYNRGIACSGHYDMVADFMSTPCGNNCVHNSDPCCVARTCVNQEVSCASDLFTQAIDYDNKNCLACTNNDLECCEPKVCGAHFLDLGEECPDTHTTNSRNRPCVNCDKDECCTPLPTLKCAEIIIPYGQAFYSQPQGTGSERTKGSILNVECDLGYKFQGAEYKTSDHLNSPDQDLDNVDFPVCNPILIEQLIEGHVEIFSPSTSGWNRAPPVCRPVTCPPLDIQSLFTPDAPGKWDVGSVIYRDAQMDTVPMRGAGYGPRDYAGEADVECNPGWIRVPNVCADTSLDAVDAHTENTLEYGLRGFWRMEGNTNDNSPHCVTSRGTGPNELGSCNDATYVGGEEVFGQEGAPIDGNPSKSLSFDGVSNYIEVHDTDNDQGWNDNQLDIDGDVHDAWTAVVWAKLSDLSNEKDAHLFARYTEDYTEIVTISLRNGYLGVIYNSGIPIGTTAKVPVGVWSCIVVRMDGEKLEIFMDGVKVHSVVEDARIADTKNGHVFIGADYEESQTINGHFHGDLDEVRYYTRGLTDTEVGCITNGKLTCSPSKYYAKPYNTQGCNRRSEEISSAAECRTAITELLQDSVLGNSLNGGQRFGSSIEDEQEESSYNNVPSKCSYREEDAQIIYNPDANGRAHTSLAPICKTNPTGSDLQTIGCLPKCLSNGQWSVSLPTCEKDWCNPLFEEWSCCKNRLSEKSQTYWLNHHKQTEPYCPINYGDCDNDDECSKENGLRGLCSQKRDLDNIDVCITDLDPCGGVVGATGTLCIVMSAVGVDYHAHAKSGIAHNLFLGGSILVFGSLAGYYMCRKQKGGDEYRGLLEEEL